MSVSNKTIGSTIASLRLKKGLTQQQLAAILGVSHQAVSKWENGTALPDLDSLDEISHLFGLTLDQLIHYEEEAPSPRRRASDKGIFADLRAEDVADWLKGAANSVCSTVNSAYTAVSDACREAGQRVAQDENDRKAAENQSAEDKTAAEEAARGMSLQALMDLAPFMNRDKLCRMVLAHKEEIGLMELLHLAPFLSRDCVTELMDNIGEDTFNLEDIQNLAPYMSREKLFGMIWHRCDRLDYDKIKKLAPFLQRGMVDALVDAVNKVQRGFTPEKINAFAKATADAAENLFGKIKDAVANVDFSSDVETAEDDGTEDSETANAPQEEPLRPADNPHLKNSVAAAALKAGSWVWLKAHVKELTDRKLQKDICLAAEDALSGEDALALLQDVAPLLEGGDADELLSTFCEGEKWSLALALCSCASSESCEKNLWIAAEKRQLDAAAALAARLTAEQLESVTQKAITLNDWELISALPI